MNKDYIRYLQKAKQTNNVYNPTKMRLRKKLGKSSDDCIQSKKEIINLLGNIPNKLIQNISIELCSDPKIGNLFFFDGHCYYVNEI